MVKLILGYQILGILGHSEESGHYFETITFTSLHLQLFPPKTRILAPPKTPQDFFSPSIDDLAQVLPKCVEVRNKVFTAIQLSAFASMSFRSKKVHPCKQSFTLHVGETNAPT